MREWFKAWRDEDVSVRNYTQYFKHLLCYLEGAWTTDVENLEEPFDSDRHQLDAQSWFDLQVESLWRLVRTKFVVVDVLVDVVVVVGCQKLV